MEVPDLIRLKLSNTANDSFEHKQAFDCYGILAALDPNNHIAKHHLANYLIQVIKESLDPKEKIGLDLVNCELRRAGLK